MDEPTQTADGLLQSYLTGSDAHCPGCGYNLRDSTGTTCPECGRMFALGLRETSSLGRRRRLLLLVFLWTLVAGVANGINVGRSIHATLTAPQAQSLFVTRLLGPGPVIVPPLTGAPVDPAVAGDVEVETIIEHLVETSAEIAMLAETESAAVMGSLQAAVIAPSASPGLSWSRVGWGQWASVAGWTLLAVIAATGLVLLVVFRFRPASARLGTVIVALAWLGFAGFLAQHVAISLAR